MNLVEPATSVIPGVTGAVLAVLARTEEPLTGRTIAGLVKPGASQRGVSNVLRDLVDGGIVDRVDKGSASLYSLNRDHVAAPAIIQLASLRQVVLDALRAAVAKLTPPPISATVFGSFARGDGGPHSDIDLLLIRPKAAGDRWASQLTDLTLNIQRRTGNPLSVIEIGDDELGAFLDEAFVQHAASEGLTVAGTPLRRALRKKASS